MVNERRALFSYPGTLFSITSALIAKGVFHSTQPSIQIVISTSAILLFTLYAYKLLRIKVSRLHALLFILMILFAPPFRLLQSTVIRPLSDVWLLFFMTISAYYYLRQSPVLSGVFAALGFLFRSQGLQLGLSIPILGGKRKGIAIVRFLVFFSLSIVTINILLRFMIYLPSVGEFAYYKQTLLDSLDPGNISSAVASVGRLLTAKGLYILYPSLMLNVFILFRGKRAVSKWLSLYALAITLISLLALFFLLVSTKGLGADPRYFIYSMIFSSIGSFMYLMNRIEVGRRIAARRHKSHRPVLRNIDRSGTVVICAALFLVPLTMSLKTGGIDAIRENITKFDYDLAGAPNVEKGSLVATEDYPYCLPYRLFGFDRTVLIPQPDEFMKSMDNAKYDYLFFVDPITRENQWGELGIYDMTELKDENGIAFRKIWHSGTKYIQYALFQRTPHE